MIFTRILRIGGFDGTSNVLAGKLFNIPVKGTHAHAYITSFSGFDELVNRELPHHDTGTIKFDFSIYFYDHNNVNLDNATGASADMLELSINHRKNLSSVLRISTAEANDSELAAMVSFAIAFPNGFMALVDTYDTKRLYFMLFLLKNSLFKKRLFRKISQNFLAI